MPQGEHLSSDAAPLDGRIAVDIAPHWPPFVWTWRRAVAA